VVYSTSNRLIKKGFYKTDEIHVSPGTFDLFIILLILQLINVFLNFPRTYSKIYIVLLNSSILKVTYFALKHMYLSIYLFTNYVQKNKL